MSRGQLNKETLEFPPFTLDQSNRLLRKYGEVLELTGKEFELASFLFRNVDAILSRKHILLSVWGRAPSLNTRTVDTHISRIRRKLGLRETGWTLASIYQHGYRLEIRPEDAQR